MARPGRRRLLIAVVAALIGVAAVVALNLRDAQSSESAADLRLPDLDQESPAQLAIRTTGTGTTRHHLLGFTSAIRNIGSGPVTIVTERRVRSGGETVLEADQLIQRRAGGTLREAGIGRLSYVVSPDHEHWHYLGFDRYELRRAEDGDAVVRDSKTGFCLGDRYAVTTRVVPGAAPTATYTDECGKGKPDLTGLTEGISVGYGDRYPAYLEFQELPLDGLEAGRYVLVHRVNADHAIRESTYANNAASVLLDLRWSRGEPQVAVLQTCPDTDRCERTVTVETVASGLEIPWDLAFLPDGSALVTERPGRVRLLQADGHLRPQPVATIDVVRAGEGGLLGIALDPSFADNALVYVYLTGSEGMRLERWRWTGSELVRERSLVEGIAAGNVHDSGRIRFGPDGLLYLATGDAGHPELAQDDGSLNGKVLTLTPAQYRGDAAARPRVLASGLRNPQSLSWQPGTRMLVVNDHGPSGFDGPEGYDEVDVVTPGGNYGWPDAIGDDDGDGRFRTPARLYLEPIAPSGGTFLSAESVWRDDYVLASLRGEQLRLLSFEKGVAVTDQPLLAGEYGRLRTVVEAPDGSLYVLTSNRDGRGTPVPGDDRILRVRLPTS